MTFDLADQLASAWQAIGAAASTAKFDSFPRTPGLSREAPDVAHIYRGRVRAEQVRERLPWLYELYRGDFLELANETCTEDVTPASDDRYGLVLNVQRETDMRFECHIDSNPLTGLLFCTDHPAGAAASWCSDGIPRPPT
jgi:hypothetical protein